MISRRAQRSRRVSNNDGGGVGGGGSREAVLKALRRESGGCSDVSNGRMSQKPWATTKTQQ